MTLVDLEIKTRRSLAEGREFAGIGRYLQLDGTAHFAVDPAHSLNSRQCCGLAYASQSESARHRALTKLQKVRMRLGGGPSILDLFPDKPPGMHWRTYGRLFNKAEAEQQRWMAMEHDYMRRHYPARYSSTTQECWSALERDYMRRHYPGVLRDESVGGR